LHIGLTERGASAPLFDSKGKIMLATKHNTFLNGILRHHAAVGQRQSLALRLKIRDQKRYNSWLQQQTQKREFVPEWEDHQFGH
jgi:hypothetical protein